MYSCTSNGALRLTPLGESEDTGTSRTAVLPMRLYEWRLAPDKSTFSYGGDEVELSVWDLETAFTPKQQSLPPQPESPSTKKRKRGSELLPGELWRAKNVCVCGRVDFCLLSYTYRTLYMSDVSSITRRSRMTR